MRKLLTEIFGELKNRFPDFKVIGREAIMSLDKDRYAKLYFTIYAGSGTPISEHYNGCKVDIFDRVSGKLDSLTISFADVFDSIIDLSHPNKIGKHIWHTNGKYSWYGRPTKKDLRDLLGEVNDYLDMVQVRETPDLEVLRKPSIAEQIGSAESHKHVTEDKNYKQNIGMEI